MATTFSMLEIFNAALISQGFDDTVADNDGSDEWRLLSRNWPSIVEAELEMGRYSFTKVQDTLSTRQNGKYGYADSYLVPAAALHVRQVWIVDDQDNRLALDWVQDGTAIHVNEETSIKIEYLEAAEASFWTASFSRAVQMKLEAVLLQFKEQYGEAERMDMRAEAMFDQARTVSSQSRSPMKPFRRGVFATARFSRG